MNSNSFDDFDWDLPNGLTINKKIKAPEGHKVYCHEPYAQELADLYYKSYSNLEAKLPAIFKTSIIMCMLATICFFPICLFIEKILGY